MSRIQNLPAMSEPARLEAWARRSKYLLGTLLGLWISSLVASPFVTVGAGQRAVLFSLSGGTVAGQLGEGTHLIVPIVQQAVYYDVRSQTYTMSATSWEGEIKGDDSLRVLTLDGQEVSVELSVRFHVDRAKVSELHKSVGPDYINKIIRPSVRSQARTVIASHTVTEVYSTKREAVEGEIESRLKEDLAKNDIILEEVLLRDVQFSPAFAKAIEDKQIAQQNAQRMQYVLLQAEKEKQQRILEAQGDARSIELKGQAIAQNSRVVQYEYARKIAPNVSAIITDGQSLPIAGGSAQAVPAAKAAR